MSSVSSNYSFIPPPSDAGQLQPGTTDEPCTIYVGEGRRYELTPLDEPGRARVTVQLAGDLPYIDTLNLHNGQFRDRLAEKLAGERRPDLREVFARDLQQLSTVLPTPTRNGGAPPPSLTYSDPDPWPAAVDGATLLERVSGLIRRFVVLPKSVADALAAWIACSYVMEAFNIAPYVIVRSPVKRCGKSLLLEIVDLLVWRPFSTVSASPATLFRVIDEIAPTCLMDEVEGLGRPGDRAEALRELLNAGYRRGPGVPRCVGEANEVRMFQVFGPKILAGIGKIWDTLEDRSLVVELRRKTREEKVARFRRRHNEAEALELRRQLRRWAEDNTGQLRLLEPALPDFLDDRAQDTWEPLLAIGSIVGWSARLEAAARLLNDVRTEQEDDGSGVLLLADLRDAFSQAGVDRLTSAQVLEHLLKQDHRPWSDWKGGRAITARQVAGLLRPFLIRPRTIRLGGAQIAKGYLLEECQGAFRAYLAPGDPLHPLHANNDKELEPQSDPLQEGSVTDARKQEKPHGTSIVTDVTDRKADFAPLQGWCFPLAPETPPRTIVTGAAFDLS